MTELSDLMRPHKKRIFSCTTILLFLLIFSCPKVFSQHAYDSADHKIFISLSPLALVDYKDGSAIRLSADVKVWRRWAVSAEAGFYTSLANAFAYKADPHGIVFKPMVKYYLNKNGKVYEDYLGLEYQYKHQRYDLDDSIAAGGSTYFKQYSMIRNVNCINVKAGHLHHLSRKILLEAFLGAGIRFFHSSTNLPREEYDAIVRSEEQSNRTGGGSQAREIGNHVYPNFTAGIKLAYWIK
jgi:hypothetical protein